MTCPTLRRAARRLLGWAIVALLAGVETVVRAQEPPPPQPPSTRAEQIQRARARKQATLWPEHEGPLVARANELLDRGLLEGVRSREGANGWQLVLTGMRPNQGQTFGVGYRRSDLFSDMLSAKGSVGGTLAGAVLVDANAELNRLRVSDETFVDFYAKYERSPRMEYYGLGASSNEADRTRYLLETVSGDVRAGYRFTRRLNIGLAFSASHVHTGPTSGKDVPSIETVFDATTAPGLFDDTTFFSWGGFLGFDARDLATGPKRGGFYGINLDRYVDVSSGRYSHRQLELQGQQFFPYFNDTRVVALFARVRFAYTGSDDGVVPFYLLPNLGGNFSLRGFGDYRFHDNNAFIASVEHRWYAFKGLEMALFVDAGETTPEKGQLDFSRLNYSGGIGFRFRLQDAVVLRFDVARSREGTRWIWSLSDISSRLF